VKKWLTLAFAALLSASCAEESTVADFAAARQRMVQTQIEARGVRSEAVLRAMRKVPRHEFVPAPYRSRAYGDYPLPIGEGQTISQPYIVAFMTEALDLKPDDRVLEIGTGSGYQAAVLAELVRDVYTIEILPALGEGARRTLEGMGYTNVHVRIGDGYKGWPEKAPFDAIIVTCAPEDIPSALKDQLKEGGRIIIPVGGEWTAQQLVRAVKRDGMLKTEAILDVRFVPMVKGKD
jgi:protein-L-isoaspartate(D-aspartate) O-methyltransferase